MERAEVITAANQVLKVLGGGLSESIYKFALAHEIRQTYGKIVETELSLPVRYKGFHVGCVRADMLVDGKTLIELKVVTRLSEKDASQLAAYVNLYTAANGGEVTEAYLINFGLHGKLPVDVEMVTGI